MSSLPRVQMGIIGGSGLYQMPELTDVEEVRVETPFCRGTVAVIVSRRPKSRFVPTSTG